MIELLRFSLNPILGLLLRWGCQDCLLAKVVNTQKKKICDYVKLTKLIGPKLTSVYVEKYYFSRLCLSVESQCIIVSSSKVLERINYYQGVFELLYYYLFLWKLVPVKFFHLQPPLKKKNRPGKWVDFSVNIFLDLSETVSLSHESRDKT